MDIILERLVTYLGLYSIATHQFIKVTSTDCMISANNLDICEDVRINI